MSFIQWEKLGNDLFNIVLTHPFEYAYVLIRIGYEPGPPIVKKNIFGHNVVGLPGIATYLKHIYSVDGITGFLPGLSPRLISGTLYHVTSGKINENFPFSDENSDDGEEEKCEKNKNKIFFKDLAKKLISSTAANIVTHPFYVVGIRSMAQFVGRETKYSNIWTSLKIIYTEQGFDGLYAGFIPRLFRDLSNVVVVTCLGFVIKSYITKRKDLQVASTYLLQLIVRNVTYPFQVIATCMAVNDAGLQAGSPPALPIFKDGWLDCWSYLAETNQLTRGLYPILRYKKISTSKPLVITHKSDQETSDHPVIEEPEVDQQIPVVDEDDFIENFSNYENYDFGNENDNDSDEYFYDTEDLRRGLDGNGNFEEEYVQEDNDEDLMNLED